MTRKWPASVEASLAENWDVTFNRSDRPMDVKALMAAARNYDVICPTVTDRIGADILEQPNRRVRLLCNYGAGFEHIDLDACQRAGVSVSNTPDVLTDATAELAILLMLMVARRAGEGERELRAGQWSGWRPTHLLSSQMTGKTLGLIGFGRIAQRTAAFARGFGMTILYHSRSQAPAALEQQLSAIYCGDLADLLERSDFVSLHCPGGPATDGLMNGQRLGQMRSTAFLVNTARGSIIDDIALATALHDGAIAGAALDVFRGEPQISDALLDAPNLVMLPHLGSATTETRTAMGLRALANLQRWANGQDLLDRVA
ncbi:D-glycerate dehydrogenase [Sphingomonas sp. Root1294]|uniref:2-hydroxyacid dehydrogenase n=1 Tax=Sphingomonas sp. Root1294 TaxID=1736447 RepID=UPI002AA2A1D5|nr:D-glycerate dehydrogenase [Sphingomonas sp. Root1294]